MTTDIKNWSTTPGDNNSPPPAGAPEGMPPSAVNDCIRQNMAGIREWYEDAVWIDYGFAVTDIDADTFRISGDQTAIFTPGRRIRAIGTGYTIYGVITAAAFTTPNTNIDVTFDSGSLDNTITSISVSMIATVGQPINSASIQFGDDTVPTDALDPDLVSDVTANATFVANFSDSLVGALMPFYSSTAPSGWLKVNSDTIGNAASGATHASDTLYLKLFTKLWDEDDTANLLPIFTSSGGASTKGGSAAADWAAGCRLSLPEWRAEFIRGLDDGRGIDASRVLGSEQADAFKAHTHTFGAQGGAVVAGGNNAIPIGGGNTGSTGDTETRPRNKAALICIFTGVFA